MEYFKEGCKLRQSILIDQSTQFIEDSESYHNITYVDLDYTGHMKECLQMVECFEKFLAVSQVVIDNLFIVGEALFHLSHYYKSIGDYVKMKEYIDRAMSIKCVDSVCLLINYYETLGNTKEVAQLYRVWSEFQNDHTTRFLSGSYNNLMN